VSIFAPLQLLAFCTVFPGVLVTRTFATSQTCAWLAWLAWLACTPCTAMLVTVVLLPLPRTTRVTEATPSVPHYDIKPLSSSAHSQGLVTTAGIVTLGVLDSEPALMVSARSTATQHHWMVQADLLCYWLCWQSQSVS
jgi:hypothetical protein